MTSSKPSWIDQRYAALWEKVGQKEFKKKDVLLALMAFKDNKDTVNVVLSELKKQDLISTREDPEDHRKTIYQLKKLLGGVINDSGKPLTKSELESLLKKAADIIRTRVDYKFILLLLFLKRINDRWTEEYEKASKELIKKGLSEEDAAEEAKHPDYHFFDFPEECRWDNLRRDVEHLPENLSKALKKLAELNPEMSDTFEWANFMQFASNKQNLELLRQLVEIFSAKSLSNASPDVLGDGYEWILRYFAPSKAKEGEVFTPREVIGLITEILDPKPRESVYDPACGSGGMLINAFKHVEENEGKYGKNAAQEIFLYGQEHNPTTLALSKMNLYIHDIRNAHLARGDTLLFPAFKEATGPKQFDLVIANPPWNQDGYDETIIKKGDYWSKRFPLGFGPKQSADWAWAQHMLASIKEKSGRIGMVIDNGCLFRGGKERNIRKKALENDWIEAVILLPEKLFYNTGAPGAIMIMRKNKPEERKKKVLFINASGEYEKHPDVRKLNILSSKNIERIVKTYNEFIEDDGFSRVVSLDEIKDPMNDYNLNVTLYVFPEEKVEDIDIKQEWKELKELRDTLDKIDANLQEHVKEAT